MSNEHWALVIEHWTLREPTPGPSEEGNRAFDALMRWRGRMVVSPACSSILPPMAVENRIVKVQKRNRALVRFDLERIRNAILRAGESIGGFSQDLHPGINERIFESCGTAEAIADFLTDAVVICLNSDPHHLIANFPPTIEVIQDEVLHVLRSHGFQHTADAYACYRWCRHWLREGAITPEQFVERINGGDPVRLMWISGPSSSGKTTTTVKLTQRLQQHGLRFLMLNLDDYFWPLVEHPTDWINDRNYETPEALDIQLLNSHLCALLAGETIEKPVFNFKDGHRSGTKPVKLESDQILLLDCLHGLYPPITEGIPAAAQFRVYIENFDVIYEGDGSSGKRVPFTDLRMLRRILRDARHRNHSPLRTILHWHYVRAGELFSIIPLHGLADAVIDGGFAFELSALKPHFSQGDGMLPATSDLHDYAGFVDARIRLNRIQSLLQSVEGITLAEAQDTTLIPGDAVTREFIGGSTVRIPHNE